MTRVGRLLLLAAVGSLLGTAFAHAQGIRIAGAACADPPVLHCPTIECTPAMITHPGPVVEMKTRRTFFLDYPCDLKKGEPVTFVLSLHGGGSYGNWMRHYFPLLDYVTRYRLVVATPNSPTRVWSDADDPYLQNIVSVVVDQLGADIRAFWLAGHSQGGTTANRLLRTEFFKTKVDGWVSLAGGRLGGNPVRVSLNSAPTAPAAAATGATAGGRATAAALATLPDADFSFIFTIGAHEMDDEGLPPHSEWAEKYSCGGRAAAKAIVDTSGGYVYDRSRLTQMWRPWGLVPAPGRALATHYPGCRDGRVVADVVRLDKGHTEGLEPKVTEEIIKLMLLEPGGKIQLTSK
jgi:hypothetical protein